MNLIELLIELVRTCPDPFDITHVESNPKYNRIEGNLVRVAVDYDSFIFDFLGKYKSKYKVIVRIWSDSKVTASIELKNRVFSIILSQIKMSILISVRNYMARQP